MNLQELAELVKDAVMPSHPEVAEARQLIQQFMSEVASAKGEKSYYYSIYPSEYPAGHAILKSNPQLQVEILLEISKIKPQYGSPLLPIQIQLFSRNLPLWAQDIKSLLRDAITDSFDSGQWVRILRKVKRFVQEGGDVTLLQEDLEALRANAIYMNSFEHREISMQIDQIVHRPARHPLYLEEAWGAAVISDWNGMAPATQSAWGALLAHAWSAEGTKPSAKWLTQAKTLMEAIGAHAAQAQITVWLETYQTKPLPQVTSVDNGYGDYEAHRQLMTLANHNYQAVKGLVWLCRCFDDAPTARLLGDVALHSLKKIPGHGPKSAKVGTACLLTLAAMSGLEPVAQLSRLKTRVTYKATLGMLDKALNAAAAKSGLTRDDLEELAVPDFGLDADGKRSTDIGEYRAEITVKEAGIVELLWTTANGKQIKSLPVSVKREHAEELKTLKKIVTELQEVIGVQKNRLEDAMRTGRTWAYSVWRERYLSHALLRLLSQRLIWQFGTNAGNVREGQIEGAHGKPLTGLTEDLPVKLWHPLTSDADSVFTWRVRLEQLSITQPFKQAHHEVYLLTDAERTTHTYTNRFATHILKQHQFSALCRLRGWQYTLQGGWDSHNVPTLHSKQFGLSAGFMVDGTAVESLLSEANIYLYVTTGAVEFFPLNGTQNPIPLAQIPPLAFSEIMRDVDLFVGVASVGNDPEWHDAARVAHGPNYWQSYAFGDLNATAKTRADVLGRLLPRLKIASRCRIDGKFLSVRGDLRTYKIHLGSGNILMEPNDQYLCIVPGRSEDSSELFLPFEGDRMLAIILSKAFLLADDKAIKDPAIVSQIRRSQQ